MLIKSTSICKSINVCMKNNSQTFFIEVPPLPPISFIVPLDYMTKKGPIIAPPLFYD